MEDHVTAKVTRDVAAYISATAYVLHAAAYLPAASLQCLEKLSWMLKHKARRLPPGDPADPELIALWRAPAVAAAICRIRVGLSADLMVDTPARIISLDQQATMIHRLGLVADFLLAEYRHQQFPVIVKCPDGVWRPCEAELVSNRTALRVHTEGFDVGGWNLQIMKNKLRALKQRSRIMRQQIRRLAVENTHLRTCVQELGGVVGQGVNQQIGLATMNSRMLMSASTL